MNPASAEEAVPLPALAEEAAPLPALSEEALPLPALSEEALPVSALSLEAAPLSALAEDALPPIAAPLSAEETFPTNRLKRLRRPVGNAGMVISACSVACAGSAEDAFVIIFLSAVLSRAFCAFAASNLADSSSAT